MHQFGSKAPPVTPRSFPQPKHFPPGTPRRVRTWRKFLGSFGVAGAFSGRRGTLRLGLIFVPLAYLLALRIVFSHSGEPWRREGGLFRSVEHRRLTAVNLTGFGDEGFDQEVVVNGTNVAIIRRRRRVDLPARKRTKVRRPALARVPWRAKFQLKRFRPKPSIAICLVGGARDFHLTGPSIVQHLLRAFPDGHVFVHAPLDENAHMLSLLQSHAPGLVSVRVAPDVPINETDVTDHVLRWVRSGHEIVTRQQLMQQFKSIETCAAMITAHEQRLGSNYTWILRTRLDGFWNGPPPPLRSLDPLGYTVPEGSDWGGVNDRLSVATRELSHLGTRRLSVLAELAASGELGLNAERAYLAQLALAKVQVARAPFPFCVLSRKRGGKGFPAAATLASVGQLNGAKCRPCEATVAGEEAEEYIRKLPVKVFGSTEKGVELCEAEDGWGEGWETTFDRQAGPAFAAVRQYMEARNWQECVRDWRDFWRETEQWDAPPPEVLCVRSHLGKVRKIGFPGGDWPTFLELLGPTSVIYSMDSEDGYSWDHRLMKDQRVQIHSFDGTPNGLRWVAEHSDSLPESWISHAWMLSGRDGEDMEVFYLDLVERKPEYALVLPKNLVVESVSSKTSVVSKTIPETMKELGHQKIDLLRIGGHWSLHQSLFDRWIEDGTMPPVCQVIISFHKEDKHYGNALGQVELMKLRKLGLELTICIPMGAVPEDRVYEACLFFSTIHCMGVK